jgi:sec-independent protein translocase protein TatA
MMFLFGPIGLPELLIILLIVVFIFGARRLPELMKSLGEGIKSFRKAISSKEDETHPEKPKPPNKEE